VAVARRPQPSHQPCHPPPNFVDQHQLRHLSPLLARNQLRQVEAKERAKATDAVRRISKPVSRGVVKPKRVALRAAVHPYCTRGFRLAPSMMTAPPVGVIALSTQTNAAQVSLASNKTSGTVNARQHQSEEETPATAMLRQLQHLLQPMPRTTTMRLASSPLQLLNRPHNHQPLLLRLLHRPLAAGALQQQKRLKTFSSPAKAKSTTNCSFTKHHKGSGSRHLCTGSMAFWKACASCTRMVYRIRSFTSARVAIRHLETDTWPASLTSPLS